MSQREGVSGSSRIIDFKKKARGCYDGARGRQIAEKDKALLIPLIEEAHSNGARYAKACQLIGISFRTLQRWKGIGLKDRRQGAPKRVVRKLDNEQRKEILMTCNSVTYRDKNPYEIVAKLLNEGYYLASVSTIYRVLREANQVHHRSKTNVRKYHSKPPERIANSSNEVWCWDITWMPRVVKGLFYYAYVILDIYDRSIVGWAIHETESVDYSKVSIPGKVYHRFRTKVYH